MRNKSPISDDDDVDEEQETPSPRQSSPDPNDTTIGYRMEDPMTGMTGESRRRLPPIPPFTLPPGLPGGMSQQPLPRPPPLARPAPNWRRNLLAAAVLLGLFAGGMLATGRAITLFGHTFRFRPSASSTGDDKGHPENVPGTGGSPLPETRAILPAPASPGTPLPEAGAARPAAAPAAGAAAGAEPEVEGEAEVEGAPPRARARTAAKRNRTALRARADNGEPEVWLPDQGSAGRSKTRGRARGRKDRGVEVQLF